MMAAPSVTHLSLKTSPVLAPRPLTTGEEQRTNKQVQIQQRSLVFAKKWGTSPTRSTRLASTGNGIVKGPWYYEEDQILLKAIAENSEAKWSELATFLPGRTGKQCRERWHNQLNPAISKEPWTEEEDRIILREYAQCGPRWADIAAELRGRTDNAVKNRWNCSMRRKVELFLAHEKARGVVCTKIHSDFIAIPLLAQPDKLESALSYVRQGASLPVKSQQRSTTSSRLKRKNSFPKDNDDDDGDQAQEEENCNNQQEHFFHTVDTRSDYNSIQNDDFLSEEDEDEDDDISIFHGGSGLPIIISASSQISPRQKESKRQRISVKDDCSAARPPIIESSSQSSSSQNVVQNEEACTTFFSIRQDQDRPNDNLNRPTNLQRTSSSGAAQQVPTINVNAHVKILNV